MTSVAIVREEGLARLPLRPEDEEVARRFTNLLRQALALLDWGPRCRGRSVLVKPNLVRTFAGRPGNTTDPRVLLGLLRALQEHQPARLLVGENPGCGVTSAKAFAESGCGRVARLAGAELRPFDREPLAEVEVPGGILLRRARVPRVWLETDLLINLPAMKTHLHTGVSLGIKNLHGLLVDEDRYFFHRMDVHQKMVDLLKIRRPDLTVVDGVLAMEGQSPFFGTTREMDLLVAGEDPVAVDAAAAWVMGFEPEEIGVIRLAASQGLGVADLAAIRSLGADREAVRSPFRRGVISSAGAYPGITALELGVCYGCLSSVRHSLDRLQHDGLIERAAPLTVVSGVPGPHLPALFDEGLGPSERCWFVGDCCVGLAYDQRTRKPRGRILAGCPPHSFDLSSGIFRAYRLRRRRGRGNAEAG